MLQNIEQPVVFQPSHTTPGLQVADLIAYLYRRRDAHVETDPRTHAAVEQLWATLEPVRGTVRVWEP